MSRIAVVSASYTQQQTMLGLLTKAGHEVTTHAPTTTKSLLNEIYSKQPDLVIMDVNIPGQNVLENGFEICRIMRQDKRFRGTQVVLGMEQGWNKNDQSWAWQQGACEVVTVPPTRSELLYVLRHALPSP